MSFKKKVISLGGHKEKPAWLESREDALTSIICLETIVRVKALSSATEYYGEPI